MIEVFPVADDPSMVMNELLISLLFMSFSRISICWFLQGYFCLIAVQFKSFFAEFKAPIGCIGTSDVASTQYRVDVKFI